MKVLLKKWIATYVDECNCESDNYSQPIPKTIKDEDGKTLVADTYDEILSLVNDDIEWWQMHRPAPQENHGFERQGNVIRVWDDYAEVYYTMEQIEIELEIEVK